MTIREVQEAPFEQHKIELKTRANLRNSSLNAALHYYTTWRFCFFIILFDNPSPQKRLLQNSFGNFSNSPETSLETHF